MSCPEYLDALTAVAFGAPDAGLRAHLAECAKCRRELDRLAALAGAIDRGVHGMVSGEPAPGFAARVRARIAEQAEAPASWLRGWVPALAGGLAVLALVVWLAVKPSSEPPAPPREPEIAGGPTLNPSPVEIKPGPKHAGVRQGQTHKAPPVQGSATPVLPEVIVAGDEWAQAIKLYRLSQQGQADAERLKPPAPGPLQDKFQPLVIAKLAFGRMEIAPLENQ